MARFLGTTIANEIGWPNPNFIPDDPVEIAMYCPAGDGGEGPVISDAIRRKLGGPVKWYEFETMGELVHACLSTEEVCKKHGS